MDKELIEDCISAYRDGGSRMQVARLIMNATGLKKTAAKDRAKTIWDNHFDEEYDPVARKGEERFGDGLSEDAEEEASDLSTLEFSDKYIYNKDSEKYVFLLESKIGKNLVIGEDKVKNIIKSYSNFKGDQSSINEIAIKYDIPRKFVIEILKCLQITHDSLPVSNEELSEKEADSLVDEILQEKRFALYQKLEKRDWIETKKQAEKWREFESGTLKPLEAFVENLEIEPFPEIKSNAIKPFDDQDTIVIGAFDWQIGSHADGRFLFFGEEWNTDKAVKTVDEFAQKIVQKAKHRGINKATIVFGGDIFHGLHGMTAKETQLKCDTVKYDQFDATIKAVVGLIQRCAENFISVDCQITTGNHEGFDFYPLFRLVESMFVNSSHVTFNISKKEILHFRVKDSMFIVHHGASAEQRFKVPNDKKGRVALVHRLMKIAERESDYEGVKRRFFIKGDSHSFEGLDMGQFTFYTFGSLPSGDEYADALALESTPCQNALTIGSGMDYDTMHVTF